MRIALPFTLALLAVAWASCAMAQSTPEGASRFSLRATLEPGAAETGNARFLLRGQWQPGAGMLAQHAPGYRMHANLLLSGSDPCTPDVIFANGFEQP